MANAWVRVTSILWRFLDDHEDCLAAAVGLDSFEIVTNVPSSDPARDAKSPLRSMLRACGPVKEPL